MSGVDPGTVFTAISTFVVVSSAGGGAWLYLKKAREAEVAKAVADAIKNERVEARLRDLEGRPPDDD